MHKPIQLQDLSLFFAHKSCFTDFNATIFSGDRIGIIGRNGNGKSTLLKTLCGVSDICQGKILMPNDVKIGYVPQFIDGHESLSGGMRFNAALTEALSKNSNLLLLDEPMNHLDQKNRRSLLRMLKHFTGTLIVVSHDIELLRNNIHTLWHIDGGGIHVFSGNYDDYLAERQLQAMSIQHELHLLEKQKKSLHKALMQEQERAAKSSQKGKKNIEQRKWPTVVSHAKASRANKTSGQKKAEIAVNKIALNDQLAAVRMPEVILPKFSLPAEELGNQTLVFISDATVAYENSSFQLEVDNFSIHSRASLAICGDNGCGKSTLIKAIMDNAPLIKTGEWLAPATKDIGYLDQNYSTLDENKTLLETIQILSSIWSYAEVRKHLNDFLFRKNEEVNALVKSLSGGEKLRLSLAQIAVKTPKLLILDEVSNNIDLETREHLIQVLSVYPGAMLIISHDDDFLLRLNIQSYWEIKDQQLHEKNINH